MSNITVNKLNIHTFSLMLKALFQDKNVVPRSIFSSHLGFGLEFCGMSIVFPQTYEI